jgi:hypothetical protein
MTSHPSSISSSESRRYLGVFALTITLMLGTLAGISAVSYRYGLIEVATRAIYNHQVEKIEDAAAMDVIFVGDSSLGSAINVPLFSDLNGAPAASLALSGTYGLGASFNMIRRAAARHDVRTAVVIHSLNTMTRSDVAAGYFFTTTDLKLTELSPIEIAKLYLNYRTAKETFKEVRKRGFEREPPKMEGGYIAQRTRSSHDRTPDEELAKKPLLPGMVSPAAVEFVVRMVDYCDQKGIRCVYAHGPIYDGYCKASAPYLETLNEAITSAGMEVVEGTPPCVPLDEVGDEVDHVAPVLRDTYTRWYYERLRPYLD